MSEPVVIDELNYSPIMTPVSLVLPSPAVLPYVGPNVVQPSPPTISPWLIPWLISRSREVEKAKSQEKTATQPAAQPQLHDLSISDRLILYARTTAQTIFASLVLPIVSWTIASTVLSLVFLSAVAWPAVKQAPLDFAKDAMIISNHFAVVGGTFALVAFTISIWGLKDYLFNGMDFILRVLQSHLPGKSTRQYYTSRALRTYHGVLKWSGICAFLSEIVMQCLAFGAASWGLAVALPELRVFSNPDRLTLQNSVLYWIDDALTYNGKYLFGHPLSPLQISAAMPYSTIAILFKAIIISLIFQLTRSTMLIRPADLSAEWAKAIAP